MLNIETGIETPQVAPKLRMKENKAIEAAALESWSDTWIASNKELAIVPEPVAMIPWYMTHSAVDE